MKPFIFLLAFGLGAVEPTPAPQAAPTNTTLPAFLSRPKPANPNPHALTQGEWQELRDAHQKALKAHPELMAKMVALAKEMRAFNMKLHTAMVEANPTLAPVVANMDAPKPAPRMMSAVSMPQTNQAPSAPAPQ
jgi:hypothetical protein